jgi:hypothetical protein
MKKQVYMSVNQSGQQSAVAEIDDLRASWTLHRGTDLSDALARDQNVAWADDSAVLNVE